MVASSSTVADASPVDRQSVDGSSGRRGRPGERQEEHRGHQGQRCGTAVAVHPRDPREAARSSGYVDDRRHALGARTAHSRDQGSGRLATRRGSSRGIVPGAHYARSRERPPGDVRCLASLAGLVVTTSTEWTAGASDPTSSSPQEPIRDTSSTSCSPSRRRRPSRPSREPADLADNRWNRLTESPRR